MTFYLHLQLQWNVYPICHLPESLQGTPISNIDPQALNWCIRDDVTVNDIGRHTLDAASSSESFLEKGIQLI